MLSEDEAAYVPIDYLIPRGSTPEWKTTCLQEITEKNIKQTSREWMVGKWVNWQNSYQQLLLLTLSSCERFIRCFLALPHWPTISIVSRDQSKMATERLGVNKLASCQRAAKHARIPPRVKSQVFCDDSSIHKVPVEHFMSHSFITHTPQP